MGSLLEGSEKIVVRSYNDFARRGCGSMLGRIVADDALLCCAQCATFVIYS